MKENNMFKPSMFHCHASFWIVFHCHPVFFNSVYLSSADIYIAYSTAFAGHPKCTTRYPEPETSNYLVFIICFWCHSIQRIHTVDARNPAWDVKFTVDSAINYQPQLVLDFFHQQYVRVMVKHHQSVGILSYSHLTCSTHLKHMSQRYFPTLWV